MVSLCLNKRRRDAERKEGRGDEEELAPPLLHSSVGRRLHLGEQALTRFRICLQRDRGFPMPQNSGKFTSTAWT